MDLWIGSWIDRLSRPLASAQRTTLLKNCSAWSDERASSGGVSRSAKWPWSAKRRVRSSCQAEYETCDGNACKLSLNVRRTLCEGLVPSSQYSPVELQISEDTRIPAGTCSLIRMTWLQAVLRWDEGSWGGVGVGVGRGVVSC